MGRRIAYGVIGMLVLAGVIGAVVTGRLGGTPSRTTASVPGGSADATFAPDTSRGARSGPAPSPAALSDKGADASIEAVGPASLQVGPRIVKRATLRLQVRKGSFAERFQQAVAVASSQGGFVETSTTGVGKFRSGTLVLRVPSASFEAALAALKGLGTVRGESVSGQDVTAGFVDLQARLRNWRSQEVVLLRLMSKATTIVGSLRVQEQLSSVQQNIEQIEGQLRLLSDQTAMGTITVSMTEAGLVVPPKQPAPTLPRSWHLALHGSVAVIGAVVVGLGYLVPLGILALLGLVLWVGVRRLRPFRPAGSSAGA